MATLDDTVYAPGKAPSRELSLYFVAHDLPAGVRKTLADSGIRTIALMAAMGADEDKALENLKIVVGPWPTAPLEGVMLGCKLKAIHVDCKATQKVQTEEQIKTLEDPEKVPGIKEPDWNQMVSTFRSNRPEILWNDAIEPNRTFVEIIRRDHLKHGKILNYALNQMGASRRRSGKGTTAVQDTGRPAESDQRVQDSGCTRRHQRAAQDQRLPVRTGNAGDHAPGKRHRFQVLERPG